MTGSPWSPGPISTTRRASWGVWERPSSLDAVEGHVGVGSGAAGDGEAGYAQDVPEASGQVLVGVLAGVVGVGPGDAVLPGGVCEGDGDPESGLVGEVARGLSTNRPWSMASARVIAWMMNKPSAWACSGV